MSTAILTIDIILNSKGVCSRPIKDRLLELGSGEGRTNIIAGIHTDRQRDRRERLTDRYCGPKLKHAVNVCRM